MNKIEKLRIKKFCNCCTIRTGSLVIGVFGWMDSLLQAIILSAKPETQKASITTDNDIVVETSSGPDITAILISIFMFGIGITMVIGIYKNNRSMILPWLIVKFIHCCIVTIIAVVMFFLIFVSDRDAIIFVIFFAIGLSLGGAFSWYCFICVWSLYMDMGETSLPHTRTGQSYPIPKAPNQQPPPYSMETKPTSPMQEIV